MEMDSEEKARGKRPRLESDFDLTEPLPRPYCTKYGKLKNGLTYYLQQHSRPKSTIEVALVVKVGSIHEQDQESGVAHLVEHLVAGRATSKVSNRSAIQNSKAKFSVDNVHNNARTSYEFTMYHFTTTFEDLPDALALLGEFSSEIDISESDLKKEKGVVLAEYNMYLENVEEQEHKAVWNSVFKDTKYCVSPIGSKEVISTISLQAVKDFYKRWYVVPNMAAIIVGDFPESQFEVIAKQMEDHFIQNDITAPPSSLSGSLPMHTEPRFHFHVDQRKIQATVYVTFTIEKPKFRTLKDLNEKNVAKMIARALLNRLEHVDIRSNYCVEFDCYLMDEVDLAQYLQIKGICNERDVPDTFEIILIEIARMRVHGFITEELENLAANILKTSEQYHVKNTSEYLRNSYLNHFLYGTPVLDLENETHLQRTLISKISKAELCDYSKTLTNDHNLSVVVSEPKESTTSKDLLVIISKINALERDGRILRWDMNDYELYDPVDKAAIIRGSMKEDNYFSIVGLREWRLSNGMRISFKHTDNDDDEVQLHGFSEGGLSQSKMSDYLTCSAACDVAKFSRSCGFQRRIPGFKEITCDVFIQNYCRWFYVKSPPSHVNAALQLVYSLFHANSIQDIEDYSLEQGVKEYKEKLSAMEKDPEKVLENKMEEAFYGREYKPLTSEDMGRINLGLALDYFKHCFSDPSNFRVIIVGNVDHGKLLDSVLLYLGGIVHRPLRERWNKFPLKRDNIKKIVVKFPTEESRLKLSNPNVGDLASVNISFPIKLENKEYDSELWTLELLLKIIRAQSLKLLRHDEGAIYEVTVSSSLEHDFSSVGTACGYFSIEFQCNQDVAWKSVDILVDEVRNLQQHGLKDINLSNLIKDLNLQWESNEDWIMWLMDCYTSCRHGGDIDRTHKERKGRHDGFMAKVSEEFVNTAFGRILTNPCNKNYCAMVMGPCNGDETEYD